MSKNIVECEIAGEKKSFPIGTPLSEVLGSLKDKKQYVAAKLNGRFLDLNTPLVEGGTVDLIETESPEGVEILRHSTSHIMAEAVKTLFPEAKVAIGPAIEHGFYYDFDVPTPFSEEDLEKIEVKMREIVSKNHPFVRKEISREEAIEFFSSRGEQYKVELLKEMKDPIVSLYEQGNFIDLCRGPHVPDTSFIRAFKLTGVAGAYWRGDEKNPMLQRIYGTAFADEANLEKYLKFLEEARKRDHRRLAKELDLFQFSDEVGAGMVIYHPKGAMLRHILETFEKREHLRRGYHIVVGPTLLRTDLWKKSGHFDNYRENMYFTEIEGQSYGIKPMNCLAHMLIYKSKIRSYRDLPIRYFELGTVHRHEKSGVLHGLLRVRQFTQDDAHILCTPDQLHGEIEGVIDFVADVMDIFGFPYEMEISTRPEKSIGSDADWERATKALMEVLQNKNINYTVCEGEGAFYGPKIDVKLKDALERRWQCATIQCDFTLPERFDLYYVGPDGSKHRPVMLHRVILGALERFIGILIEHFAGAFPLWIAPVQAILLTVTEKQIPYAKEMLTYLQSHGVRAELDDRNEKLGFKIREAQMQKIPYMLVIGDREVQTATVTPRRRDGSNLDPMTGEALYKLLEKECREATKGRIGLGII